MARWHPIASVERFLPTTTKLYNAHRIRLQSGSPFFIAFVVFFASNASASNSSGQARLRSMLLVFLGILRRTFPDTLRHPGVAALRHHFLNGFDVDLVLPVVAKIEQVAEAATNV
jgi:hypothetical protein